MCGTVYGDMHCRYIEDEFHLVLKCIVYDYFRKLHIKSIIELTHPYSNLINHYVLRILKICVICVFVWCNLITLDKILL